MEHSDAFSLDFGKVIPLADMKGEDDEDTALLAEMAVDAVNYLKHQKWCGQVTKSFFGLGVGGVVAVFLFKIIPSVSNIDNYVWVVVGDLPPLYIAVHDAPNPACALDGYIGAMDEWACAAVSGQSTEGLPPVAVEATPENGNQLLKRLEFIDRNILQHYHDDLRA